MKRRLVSMALCLLLSVPLCLSAQQTGPFTMAGYDPEDVMRDWRTNSFFARMEEKTGIHFVYQQYGRQDAWTKAKADMAEGRPLPDVLFKAELTPAETIEMVEKGVLIDLKPLLPEYAPHLWALLKEQPEYLAAVTLPGGQIAALPFIDTAPLQNCLWINARWLETLKMDMPASREELEAVLLAFRDGDPNRNGKKDEVPLIFLGAYDLKYLAHAFGLAANDFNVFARNGQARFLAEEEQFMPFIRWCRSLYEQGLLDRDGFSTADALRRVNDKKSAQVYGALLAPLPTQVLPLDWTEDYRVMPPLSFEGKTVYRSPALPVTTGCFAVTGSCQDPGAMLRWVDYLYTPEGAVLASEGVEGEDYLVDGDGTWRKTPAAESSAFLSNVAVTTGGAVPGISAERFEQRYQDVRIADMAEQISLVGRVARVPFPPYSLTAGEEAYILPLQRAVGRYVDECIARWVIGEWATDDAQFDLFRQELKERGLEDFMAFWQQVLDRQAEATK